MSEKRRLICTAIAVILLGIVTGLFLGGGLLPPQSASQMYDEKTTTSRTVLSIIHAHEDISRHEHKLITVVTITETTPHGTFHDFAATMAVPGTTPTSATSTPARGANEVWIITREFQPQTMTVPVGTTVTWKNRDHEEHTVTSDDGIFNMRLTAHDATTNYTFTVPGTFSYNCDPHPNMTGKVIVK